MFATLQQKLEGAFRTLRGKGVVTAADVASAMKEVRMALLEADVNFKVAKELCARVAEKAVGEQVLKSLSPDQLIVKFVHDELVETLGRGAVPLDFRVTPPAVILLVGLQGSGKTTASAKLGRLLKAEMKRRPLLVPADVYRPAAIEQLRTLGRQIGVDVLETSKEEDPVRIAVRAKEYAAGHGFDTVVIDTAGRLQVDEVLMDELRAMTKAVTPVETLLVADAMTGQEAVNVAGAFDAALGLTGIILTKLDGDARGGAAISVRAVTGKPIKFVGVGEKPDALEVFHPERLATRILGMGDVVTLVEKVTKEVDPEQARLLGKKVKRGELGLDDFLAQLKAVRRMGSLTSIAGMIPGMGKMMEGIDPDEAEKSVSHMEAIVLSMTPKERADPGVIDGSRRRRIAAGSGRSVTEVNTLLKQFLEMKKLMTRLSKGGLGGLMDFMKGSGIKMPPGFPKR